MLLEMAGYLGAVIYYDLLMSLDFERYGMMGVIILVHDALMFVYVFTYPKYQGRSGDVSVLWGGIRGCHALLYLILPGTFRDGKFLVWLIFLMLLGM